MMLNLKILVLALMITNVSDSYFLGASFSWTPVSNNTIEISFRISWRRIPLYYCDTDTIKSGKLISDSYFLTCVTGCTDSTLAFLNFYCTDFSDSENWTTGRNTVLYETNVSQFSFGLPAMGWWYWWRYSNKTGDWWNLVTTVNLVPRSDSGKINSSPTVDAPPVLNLQYGCTYNFQLPVSDSDGDVVRCRWNEECADFWCNYLPGAVLDREACAITYTPDRYNGYWYYPVALQIEDFMTPESTTALSSIPVQFLVRVYSGGNCADAPEFVEPTPEPNTKYSVEVGVEFVVMIRAKSTAVLKRITTTSAIGMTRSSEIKTHDDSWNYITLNVTWEPKLIDVNKDFSLCFYATDVNGVSSNTQCVRMSAIDIIRCEDNPCVNGATCEDLKNGYRCLCLAGYTGTNCDIDIDECASTPCKNGATCTNMLDSYRCHCANGFYGDTCNFYCSSEPADVVFVIDSSDSIWTEDFVKALMFTEVFIKSLDVGPRKNQSRVGLTTFGHAVWPKFNLNTFFDKELMMSTVQELRRELGRRTNAADALSFVRDIMMSDGSGGRDVVNKLVVFISDGLSQENMLTQEAAASLRAKGIFILPIGNGHLQYAKELMGVSSSWPVESFLTLNEYVDIAYVRQIVDDGICTTKYKGEISQSNHKDATTATFLTETEFLGRPTCDKEWAPFSEFCYLFSKVSMNFSEANNMCNEHNGSLAVIDNKEENDWIKQQVRNFGEESYWWLGLHIDENEGSQMRQKFQNPPTDNEQEVEMCVALSCDQDFQWSTTSCESMNFVVCEKKSTRAT